MAGTRFITRILVTPSIFKLMARMSREPTELISAMTSGPSNGERREASTAMSPSHKNTGIAAHKTPAPIVEANTRADTPSKTDLDSSSV